MNRRQVINRLALISGGVLLTSSGLLEACHLSGNKRTALTQADVALLDEIGETIIPSTASSPGAKAAKIGAYMLVMVNDCYDEKQQIAFIDGLNKFDEACMAKFNKRFIDIATAQKKEFLTGMQRDSASINLKPDASKNKSLSFFDTIKQLTISGYFTSEIGATKARRYEAIPGSYNGHLPYKQGDRAWATS